MAYNALNMAIKFTADLEPVPFPRPSTNGKRRYNPPRYSIFKDVLGHLAKIAMKGQAPFTGKIKLSIVFYKLRPADITSRNWGDLDNHIKAVMDSLIGIAFIDDRQVSKLTASKEHGKPHIFIELEEV